MEMERCHGSSRRRYTAQDSTKTEMGNEKFLKTELDQSMRY